MWGLVTAVSAAKQLELIHQVSINDAVKALIDRCPYSLTG